jgi:hypothetical protein
VCNKDTESEKEGRTGEPEIKKYRYKLRKYIPKH